MKMDKISNYKTILITGSTSGIGLESARYLSDLGYRVVLVGRNEEILKNISEELKHAEYIVSDLERTESIKEIFEHLQNEQIILDGLVHSAGYAINVPIRSSNIEHMERQMKIHYYAFVELCKYFYSRKISNDGSSIVAISSLASVTKLKGSILYASSKSALNSAVSIASKEFVKRSIRVNGLMPAYVDTRMNSELSELIDINEKQPMGLIPPKSIAEVVEFLLSKKSQFITGAIIPISAGMEF